MLACPKGMQIGHDHGACRSTRSTLMYLATSNLRDIGIAIIPSLTFAAVAIVRLFGGKYYRQYCIAHKSLTLRAFRTPVARRPLALDFPILFLFWTQACTPFEDCCRCRKEALDNCGDNEMFEMHLRFFFANANSDGARKCICGNRANLMAAGSFVELISG